MLVLDYYLAPHLCMENVSVLMLELLIIIDRQCSERQAVLPFLVFLFCTSCIPLLSTCMLALTLSPAASMLSVTRNILR